MFVQNVKIDRLPKLDFESSVLEYATQPSQSKKLTQKIAKKQSEAEMDIFGSYRDHDNENYFFQPKIEQENIRKGVKFSSSELLNGVKINTIEIENQEPNREHQRPNQMTLQ